MPVNVLMPALSPTMTDGTLAKWHVKEGDTVSAGDVIAEIETDKATMEVEAVDEGRVGKILVAEGTENVAVNDPIAILLEEGEDDSALKEADTDGAASGAKEDGANGAKAKTDAGKKESEGAGATDARPRETASPEASRRSAGGNGGAAAGQTPVEGDAPPAPAAPKDAEGNRVFASPLARRMARQADLDLTRIKGSGPHGRIVRADVEQAIERGVGAAPARETAASGEAPAKAPAPAAGPSAKEHADAFGLSYEEAAQSSMRKTIARRMVESKQAVPHFYLTVDIEMDELLKVRKELNARAEARGEDYKLSVNDFLIRACALALREVPAANASYNGDTALMYDHADISVAVAIEGGLITPIVKKAETKGLARISREMKDLATRARDGKLKPEEFQGGTFSLSNLGMFGVKHFEAIINPPQACILAVGKSEQRPVVKDGALAIATVMSATLSVDHRVVDGAIGAQFLDALKRLLEDPMTMML